MEHEPSDFATFLAWVRGPLSVPEAAKAVGVSPRSWNYYEGGRLPRSAVFTKIVNGLTLPASLARRFRAVYEADCRAANVAKRMEAPNARV